MSVGDTVTCVDATTKGTETGESGVYAGADNGRTRCVRSLEEDDELPCKGATITRNKRKVSSSKKMCREV